MSTYLANIISFGLMWYTDMSSKLLNKPSDPELWELEPLLSPLKIPDVPEAVRKAYDRPNSAVDTPWNKARDMMEGGLEAKLYSRYGEVAAALRKAGESGTEEEKERARADFRAWLDSLEEAELTGP